MLWRLWAEGLLPIADFDNVTLLEVDKANRFLNAWRIQQRPKKRR